MTDDVNEHVGQTPNDAMHLIRWLFIAAILVGLLLVAMDNRDDVRVGYAIGDAEAPIWIVIILAAVAGVFIGWLIRHRPRHRD